ncbi:MAG: TetR/AcrR family transcriptional regulator [Acidimicrobiia bacterium]|nr:TetR/AcrR family transcriptional regulator [Acidimicrobiia bacterium]
MAKASATGEVADDGPPAPETLIPSQLARRRRIVVSALHLLEESHYEKIQMRDIAESADVAIGTVYRYFASKEHLFAAVLVEWSGMLESRVQRRPLRGDDPAARLKDMMSRVLNSFERWPQFFAVVMVLESTPDVHARELYGQFSSSTTDTFREALDGLSHEDSFAVMQVTNAVLSGLVRSWILGLIPMSETRARMERSIDLIFSPPPELIAESSSA